MSSCNPKEAVDLIVINATVYTVDETFTRAESFAVKDGIIVATGSGGNLQARYRAGEVVDAGGMFIYPGFNDAHCHFSGYGENLMLYADLRGTSGPEEIYEIVRQHHKKFGGAWVLGSSWDQNDWEATRFPDKARLDALFPDTPVYLVRVDGHAAWCNSRALQMAGITADTKVDGGMVVVHNGDPTGILLDNAMGLVSRLIPPITNNQLRQGVLEAQRNCFAVGLTSVTDAGLDKSTVLLLQEMQSRGELMMRINAILNPTEENFAYFVKRGPQTGERMVINTIKLYADGALGSRGALLLDDYSDDPGNRGIRIASQAYYDDICQRAYDHHFSVSVHCIGDGANRLMLDTYAKFLKGKNDRRWRIEHAQIIDPDDFEKFARFSIVPSVQATHATSDMHWAGDRLGEKRLQHRAYAYQTLLHQMGWLANGTDFPVEHIEPLFTFYASVFRTDHDGRPEGGFLKEEGLTREQALRSITLWPAKASFGEDVKGSLSPGKQADFVIIDTDLMTADPQDVLRARIESTWIAGEKVYEQ